MKKFKQISLTLLIMICQFTFAAPSDDFVIVVMPGNSGTFTIPTVSFFGEVFLYNYNVDCDDDGTDEIIGAIGNYTCVYLQPGIHTVRISDNNGDNTGFPRIYFNNGVDKSKIIDVAQWGTGQWTTMKNAFWGAENMAVTATDVPNFSQVTSMLRMFEGATLANPDTSHWDTANVTNMNRMFANATMANPETINWDISNVTQMIGMFVGVTIPTNDYDHMLAGFTSQNLIPQVTFHGGDSKYCDITAHQNLDFGFLGNNWNITDGGLDPDCPGPQDDFVFKVKTHNPGTTANNQFLIPTIGVGYSYTVDCDDDGNDEAIEIEGNYTCSYPTAGSYTIRIKNKVGVEGFPRIYFNNDGDKDKITTILQWGTGKWLSMEKAFYGASNLEISATDILDVTLVTNMDKMFKGVVLPTVIYDDLLISFDSQNLQPNILFDGGDSFYCAKTAHDNLELLDQWGISDAGLDPNCPTAEDDFVISVKTDNQGSSLDNEFIISTYSGGYDYNVDCDNDGILEVRHIHGDYTCVYPIAGTYTLRIIDGTLAGTGFPRAFFAGNAGAVDGSKITNLMQWGTGKWDSMIGTFADVNNMYITATDSPDLSQVTSMRGMFFAAPNANPNTSNWNTANVTDMGRMFHNATSANPDVSTWVTGNVMNMSQMFEGATSANPDVSSWNTANVSTMNRMFYDATSAIPEINYWNVTGLAFHDDSMTDMFVGVALPTALYDSILQNFSGQTTGAIVFNAGNSRYCNVVDRAFLSSSFWSISDGGLDPNCPTTIDDIIFKNSFEIAVTVFSVQEKQFVFDFSLLENIKLDSYPELIAIGVNNEQEQTIKVHIRMFNGQLQIRMSHFYQDGYEGYWETDEWQDIYNDKMTSISW